MNPKKKYLNFIFIILFVYYGLAAIGRIYTSRMEIFPFFHWGLFYAIPQKIQTFDLDIYKKEDHNFVNKTSIYNKASSIDSLLELRYNVELIYNCKGKVCFDGTIKEISKYISKDEKAFFISKNTGIIDTLGIIENQKYRDYK